MSAATANKVVSRLVTAVAAVIVIGALVAAGLWIVHGHPDSKQVAVSIGAPAILSAPSAAGVQQLVPVTAPPPTATPIGAPDRPPCSDALAGTLPHVAQVGNFLRTIFEIKDIGGAVGRAGDDHGAGLALDLMMPDRELGDAVANYVLANRAAFDVTYIIWQQQYNDGGGWSMMEDRGSPTANHYDHVHVSFKPSSDIHLTC
ncbi:hypothetical protein [Antrihabitans sp. YC2-6]|uniref:hypothetical protein n=1 Tax=Antrihabitans sp. YC2-6 TaxID=2799498 RepID=UPI0018F60A2D|nr:hypothetical protein [Antrihabitans sp. YC2-6]MBJ8348346.1 hypothetical protein [Antrihabitans sp. YC2-6]